MGGPATPSIKPASREFSHDLVILGCGPSGMSAAIAGVKAGLQVLVLDEQRAAGGQIYRNIEAISKPVAQLLGPDYQHGSSVAARFAQSGAEHRRGAMVWDVAPDLTVSYLAEGVSRQVRGRQLILATGAIERASPLPGWTLPGVLNAGAAQIALKSAASIPSGRIVLMGTGPLLLLVACQLLDAGGIIAAVVDTSPASNRWKALRHAAGALSAPSYLKKGLQMMRRLRAAGVPRFNAATDLSIEGRDKVQAVAFKADGRSHRIDAETVLLHHGVVPNTQVSRLLRLEHRWSDDQLAWVPEADAWGATSMPGVRIAGDGAGIAGARAAEASGSLAALGAARALNCIDDATQHMLAAPWQAEQRRHLRIRPFLEALFQPPNWLAGPSDDTIVCRCEEVSAGKIREMARLGCQGPNQTKFFSRCGMGPCQGRMCGLTVTQILAAELGRDPAEVGAYHIRAPLKPVPLGSLAALSDQL